MADADFDYTEMFPVGPDETEYRLVSTDGVSTFETPEGTFLKVEPEAIRKLTAEAMHDIAHFLRTSHLEQLRKILDDPEASDNDRFVALDLLKNACDRSRWRAADVPRHRHSDRQGQEGRVSCSPAAATKSRSPEASPTPTSPPTCATARWRRSTCTPRRTPARTSRQRSRSMRSTAMLQVPLHGQRWRLGQQEFSVPRDQGPAERSHVAAVDLRQDPGDRHLCLPALPPCDRHRRHLC